MTWEYMELFRKSDGHSGRKLYAVRSPSFQPEELSVSNPSGSPAVRVLNDLGSEGWQVVSFHTSAEDEDVWMLQRRLS